MRTLKFMARVTEVKVTKAVNIAAEVTGSEMIGAEVVAEMQMEEQKKRTGIVQIIGEKSTLMKNM